MKVFGHFNYFGLNGLIQKLVFNILIIVYDVVEDIQSVIHFDVHQLHLSLQCIVILEILILQVLYAYQVVDSAFERAVAHVDLLNNNN